MEPVSAGNVAAHAPMYIQPRGRSVSSSSKKAAAAGDSARLGASSEHTQTYPSLHEAAEHLAAPTRQRGGVKDQGVQPENESGSEPDKKVGAGTGETKQGLPGWANTLISLTCGGLIGGGAGALAQNAIDKKRARLSARAASSNSAA